MKKMHRRIGTLLLTAAIAALGAQDAGAFYLRGFVSDVDGELVFPRWPFGDMDVNGDGDVAGDGEGVLYHFESGPNGFTADEKAMVIEAFDTWEQVPSSYIAFRFGQDIPDPTPFGMDLETVDFLNVVAIQVPEDTNQVALGAWATDFTTFTTEDVLLTVGGVQTWVAGGQVLDADLVFDGTLIRPFQQDMGTGFVGLGTIGVGSLAGLHWSPFDNFDPAASEAAQLPIEKRVLWLPDATGTLRKVGVTPSMYNSWFFYEDSNGVYTESLSDLAPDDIAGITYLYPRTDSGAFFSLTSTARTQANNNIPSVPRAGGHVMAWVDTDNNPASARVPFMDTLTGYYWSSEAFTGHFSLKNLFTSLQDANGTSFAATYTITCSVFEPAYFTPDDFNYIEGNALNSFDTLFPSEVYRESGNIFGIDNLDQGTPLTFDLTRRKVVSANSGKSLDTLLAAGKPMFGTANRVCPLNVIVAGMDTNNQSSKAMRTVRDSVLLNNAVGTAFMDAYYRAAPSMAEFLLAHAGALAVARGGMRGAEWLWSHCELLALMAGAVLAVGVLWRRLGKRGGTVAGLLLLTFALAMPASAITGYRNLEEYVADSESVVSGKVTVVDSHWKPGEKLGIETDITIEVEDVLKGRANKGGKVHITMPIGQVGGLARTSNALPKFAEGEEVLLFLKYSDRFGYQVAGGVEGKYRVLTDKESGRKYVWAGRSATKVRLLKAVKEAAEKDADDEPAAEQDDAKPLPPNYVALDDMKSFIRDTDRKQRQAREE